jgi:hypothetical protein
MYEYTQHAQTRMAHRNLTAGEIDYIVVHGKHYHQAGALIYYLRRRDIPAWDQANDEYARLAGTAVVLTKDSRCVITTWRNLRSGLKHIRCKPKYSLTEEQLGLAG